MQHDDRFRETSEIYAKAWSAVGVAERRRLLEQSVHPDCVYTDPVAQCHGHAALADYLEQLQVRLPGVSFVTQAFAYHHDQALANWTMVNAEGVILNPGTSFARFEDGRLIAMTGFFPPPPFAI